MIDLDTIFTDEERAALALLVRRGFMAFTAARLDDVRELSTGKRWRTFRNRGRYDLVLALRSAAALPEDPEPTPQTEAREPDPEAPQIEPGPGPDDSSPETETPAENPANG